MLFWRQYLLATLVLTPTLYGMSSSDNNIGYEYMHELAKDQSLASIVSFQHRHEWTSSDEAEATQYKLLLRFWVDEQRRETMSGIDTDNIEKIIAYVERPFGSWRLVGGLAEVVWGENLLMPILDVVNPRNPINTRGYYDPNAKMPVPMLRAEWGDAATSLQLIAVPLPLALPQPAEVADFKVDPGPDYKIGRDAEYGFRLGTLAAGLDSKFYYYRHWARVPTYRFKAYSTDQSDIVVDQKMGDTIGLTTSIATYSWLLRTDLARHTSFPATNVSTEVERTTLDQAILGLSWSSDDQQTIGGEFHADIWEKAPVAYDDGAFVRATDNSRVLTWLGLTANLRIADGLVEPALAYFHSLQKDDELVRALFPWNATDQITLGLEYMRTNSNIHSPKLLLGRRESLAIRASYSF